jgi:putative transposase
MCENQTVRVESLAVKPSVPNHQLTQAISDASWRELVRQLEYKATW